MTDRKKEKVITALEHCADNTCTGCPMLATCEEVGFSVLAADLLEMIRPRVLTLDEAMEADICWAEAKGNNMVVPTRLYYGKGGLSAGSVKIRRLIAAPEELPTDAYGAD